MKLMNTEETTKKINEVIADAQTTMNSIHTISVTLEPNVEKDNNGTVFYKFHVKKKGLKTEKSFALYFFERKNGISTFLVNGETLDLLFENSTMNSPEIVMSYLKKVLEGDIKWLLATKEKPQKKPYAKKPYQKSAGGYKKPYPNKPYRKDGNSSNSSRPAKRYDANGKPIPGASTYKKPGSGYHKPSGSGYKGSNYQGSNQRNQSGYKKTYQNTNNGSQNRSSYTPYYMTPKNETK